MAKKPQKLLVTTILLTILLISSAYAITVPSAHAQAVATSEEKGLTILSLAAGVNLAIYKATPTLDVAGSYLGVLPTENIRYTLTGFGGTIEIQDTFTNGSLQIMDVLENTPSPLIPALPASSALRVNESYALVERAKIFLNNYQSYSANSFYGQLASTLNNANPTKNSTTTIGNINFNINTISGNSALGNSTTFTWSYTFNGVNADCKCVSLTYENGYLKSFIDTWKLYPIGSTTVNLSEQQAENIAMQNAKTCTWTIGSGNQKQVINNFNITKPVIELLEFAPAGNASNARSSDPLTLYPMWCMGIGLDKWYPGNAYGISVEIWADTEKIRDKEAEFSTLPPPAGAAVATIAESSIPTVNNQTSPNTSGFNIFPAFWIVLAAFVFTILSIPVWLSRKKNLLISLRLPKLRTRVLIGAILCILIMGTASLVPAAHAGSALIWGNDADGSNGTLIHTPNEISNQTMIAAYITDLFQSDGYAFAWNFQGPSTYPADIQWYEPIVNQYYPPTATIWFDHGIGMQNVISGFPYEFHFMLCGTSATNGNPSGDVFDYQIYNYPDIQNNAFSYISACMSSALSATYPNGTKLFLNETGQYGANPTSYGFSGEPIGMPFAWTHGASMSSNGYAGPDSGAHCYIGFPWGSASLSQDGANAIDNKSGYSDVTYGEFVADFFFAALSLHDSVYQALNYASDVCWNEPFGESNL